MNINFMTGSKYEKDSSHVKLMIIDKDGNSYIANRSSDGGNMREEYGLDFYDKNHRCEYHIDYLQVLLKRYFSDNKNYQKFIGNPDNFNTFGIISKLVEDGYIVFETSHLSQYGIIATKVEEKTEQTKNETNNPKTGDNIAVYISVFAVAVAGITATMIIKKRNLNK